MICGWYESIEETLRWDDVTYASLKIGSHAAYTCEIARVSLSCLVVFGTKNLFLEEVTPRNNIPAPDSTLFGKYCSRRHRPTSGSCILHLLPVIFRVIIIHIFAQLAVLTCAIVHEHRANWIPSIKTNFKPTSAPSGNLPRLTAVIMEIRTNLNPWNIGFVKSFVNACCMGRITYNSI